MNRSCESEIARRQILRAALSVAIPPLCCTTPQLRQAGWTFEKNRITVDLARAPELRRPGAACCIVDPGRTLNLLLIHAGKGTFVAMDRACTHNGAQCTYNPNRRTVQCTSLNHAEYDLNGTLLHGRTHGDLRTYPVRFSRSTLEIRLERYA